MEIFHGSTEIIARSPLPQFIFSTDACPAGEGGGGQFGHDWFCTNWESDFQHFSSLHLHNCMVNKETANFPLIMLWLRDIFWFKGLSNFRITARYISTKDGQR